MTRFLPAAVLALVFAANPVEAQVAYHGGTHTGHGDHPELHINPRWKECSFQLNASLTQAAWRQFSEEAGLVVYFRPLADARPMGRGNFEVSLLQWSTGISATDDAWNDTFVHPDSTHWLFEGSRLAFPGLLVRAGVGERTDLGFYVTKSPGANYGFVGGAVQRALGSTENGFAAAGRMSFVTMYGPEDVSFSVMGTDLFASRTIPLARWAAVSPYAGVSAYLSNAHEKSSAVALDDARVVGGQAMAGAAVQLFNARLSAEYNLAKVQTLSFKVGAAW